MRGHYIPGFRSSRVATTLLWQALVMWTIIGIIGLVYAIQPVTSTSYQSPKINRATVQIETATRAAPPAKPDSLETYAVRNELTRQFNGGTAVSGPRSIQDWVIEDFILIATVDGTLQARDRKTGMERWELFSENPVVETIYHRNDSKDRIEDDEYVWIVEPSQEGALFIYHPKVGLEKMDMTMKELVGRSPLVAANKAYSGEKQTQTYAIDGRTGDILRIFKTGGGAKMRLDTSRCKPHQADDLEDECESKDVTILVSKTDYTVTIEDAKDNKHLWTLKYSEWGPNNNDLDLAAQYREPMDNRYIYTSHDGRIHGHDRSRGGSPVYTHVLNSPVARVFDVVRSTSTDKATFLVLPQPFVSADRPADQQSKVFVGCTQGGGWYALSEMSYPFVSERGRDADCYTRKLHLSELTQEEKERVLVGIHRTEPHPSLSQSGSPFSQHLPLIAAPTEPNPLDKPKISDNTIREYSPSPVKKLAMTNKWSIVFAIPLCLVGFLYTKLFNKPGFSLKWNFEVVRDDPIPAVQMDARMSDPPLDPSISGIPTSLKQGINDTVTEVEIPVPAPEPVEAANIEAEIPSTVSMDVKILGGEAPVVEHVTVPLVDNQVSLPEAGQELVLEEVVRTPDVPEKLLEEVSEVPGLPAIPAVPAVPTIPAAPDAPEGPEVSRILEVTPEAQQNVDPELKMEVTSGSMAEEEIELVPVVAPPEAVVVEPKTVRFQEERPKTPAPEVMEEIETQKTPTTPTTPTPKKKKAHRGQRGGKNKKKANKAQQQAEENDEIGRIVDRAKDLQQSIPTLQPDVQVLHSDPADIDSDIIRIDNLEVNQDPQSTLGLGSQGTVVFKGKFEGRAVAVKRMLKTFFDVAHREVKLLQDSDDHPNVIRYHCMKELDQFLYIALEQCRASLCDVIVEPKHEDLRNLLDPQQVLKQILAGVNHLHQMKIVHRDLKPQNILVSEPKRFPRDPTKVQHPRILISDFGLCKQLEAGQSSFRATTAHAAGTSGWRAPELLMDEGSDMRPFSSSTLSETSGGSSTETALFDGLTNRRATRSIDIFSMGCVFFFVLTQGGHPFGSVKYSRELNVITSAYDLSPLDILGDTGLLAKELIQKMIHRQPKLRPDTQTISMHPYFWTPERRLLFLIDSSDRFEKEKDSEKDAKYKSPHIPILERDAKNIVKGDWLKRIDKAFHDEVMGNKRRGYDGEKVLDLLRVIRNKRNHYQDMSKAAQKSLGPLPEGYLSYFTRRFPDLFLHVYRVNMETGFAAKDLRAYYLPPDL